MIVPLFNFSALMVVCWYFIFSRERKALDGLSISMSYFILARVSIPSVVNSSMILSCSDAVCSCICSSSESSILLASEVGEVG